MSYEKHAEAIKDDIHIYEYTNVIAKSIKVETGPKLGHFVLCIRLFVRI